MSTGIPQERVASRKLIRLLATGWATVFAAVGLILLYLVTPLGGVAQAGHAYPEWVGILASALGWLIEPVPMIIVALAVVLFPATPLWGMLGALWRRSLVAVWGLGIAAVSLGWVALIWQVATTTEEDLGLGLIIAVTAPILVVAVLISSLVSTLAWMWWRTRLTSAST